MSFRDSNQVAEFCCVMFMIQALTPEMDFQKDSITDKRFAINVTMKYLNSFVISAMTYYVFQSMSMAYLTFS